MNQSASTTDLSTLKIDRDGRKTSSKKPMYFIIAAIILAIAGYFLFSDSSVKVKTLTITASSLSGQDAILTGQGYVVAQVKAAISSKATGRLEALYVIEGDKVQSGNVIGRIESNDVQAFLSQQKAQMEVIKASLANAQAEYDDANAAYLRQKALIGGGAGTQAELDIAQFRWQRAQAQIRSAQAQMKAQESAIRAAQVQVENTIIRAPFDGTVLTKNANVGEVITALGAAAGARGAVVTLADMSSLEVEADVSESSLSKISQDQPVEISVSAIAEKKYAGIVSKIIPTADRGKGTVKVKIRFTDLDERVLPEMAAKVNFLRVESEKGPKEAPKILIPKTAVLNVNGNMIAFIVGPGSTAKEVTIKTGKTFGDYYEVISGLSSGTSLIISGMEQLKNGSSIALEKE
ncbi:MAG: efflux RND transporter periplasmic adaptor subunit [Bacteroidetes bacterium]|nr:efflux RND transporter periplasmic adaptor subunit [bacterium]NBP63965.1 efflux RND transporter periplasmic adaptor subunit [Bacteroidota bacterium]